MLQLHNKIKFIVHSSLALKHRLKLLYQRQSSNNKRSLPNNFDILTQYAISTEDCQCQPGASMIKPQIIIMHSMAIWWVIAKLSGNNLFTN